MQNSENVDSSANNDQSIDRARPPADTPPEKKGMGCMSVFGLIVLTVIVSVALTVWFLNWYLFPKRFEPVELTAKEQQVLEHKLDVFEGFGAGAAKTASVKADGESASTPGKLEPIPYSEVGADRTLSLSERELNAILAKNTDLADKLAIDLSDDLVSARLRLPLDPDFPFFGGKTLKARAGLELRYQQEKPVVILKGVSVMGVPIPNAWLGGLKNIDLVSEFGEQNGFWKSLSEGVKHVQVVDGDLQIKLRE